MTFAERLNSQGQVFGWDGGERGGQRGPGGRRGEGAGHEGQHFQLGIVVAGGITRAETEVGEGKNCKEEVEAGGKQHR